MCFPVWTEKKLHGDFTVSVEGIMTNEQIMETIKRIVAKGNNAEVKRRKDGTLVVYEVKKSIAAERNSTS